MKKLLLFILLASVLIGCKKDELNCKQQVIVSKVQFEQAAKDMFNFKAVTLDQDCLSITISYGGGCGEVSAKLIDSGDVAESLPVQRYLRLAFKDDDLCEALLDTTFLFDLTPIRVAEDNTVRFTLDGWSREFFYNY